MLGKLGAWGLPNFGAPRYAVVVVRPDGAALRRVSLMVEKGFLRPVMDRARPVWPLRAAGAAHAYLERGHARGKVVLDVIGEDGGADAAALREHASTAAAAAAAAGQDQQPPPKRKPAKKAKAKKKKKAKKKRRNTKPKEMEK